MGEGRVEGDQVVAEVVTYPREDVCAACGEHLGWVMVPEAEMFALGVCERCREAAWKDRGK